MKPSKLFVSLAAAGLISAAALPVRAAVLDAWQMQINGTTYANIGRLSLTAGSSTVIQQLDATNNVFVGASFTETGAVYSISYVPNSVVGPADSGMPASFNTADALELSFSNVTGTVTSVSAGGGFDYVFTGGTYQITAPNAGAAVLATGSVAGGAGSFLDHNGFAGQNGSSVVDIAFDQIAGSPAFSLMDSSGNPLDISTLLFEGQTNNQIGNGPGDVVFGSTRTECGGLYENCAVAKVNTNGDAYLQVVPEPATVALMGIGLLGVGVAVRKRKA